MCFVLLEKHYLGMLTYSFALQVNINWNINYYIYIHGIYFLMIHLFEIFKTAPKGKFKVKHSQNNIANQKEKPFVILNSEIINYNY